jgi:undecaprenyl-diphosphatase
MSVPMPDARTPSLRLPRGVLVVASSAFAVLALAVLLVGTVGADSLIRDHLLAAASPGVIAVMRVVNVAGDWRFLLPATLLLFVVFDRARRAWWVWITLMVAAPLAESVLKIAVGRPRPEGPAYGFPSGHATAAAAYFGAVLYLSEALRPKTRRVVRVVAVIMIVLVGIARVMLRAHWPSDVVGGFALGLALASAATVVAAGRGA